MEVLENKVIIVAGGASGVGAATTRMLAKKGAKVVVCDISEEGAASTANLILDDGDIATPFCFDLADELSIKNMFAYTIKLYGRLDGLYNVGADFKALAADSDILNVSRKTWDRTLEVDLTGYFLTMREAIPIMLKQGSGAIVNTTSAAAFSGMPNLPAYAAAKAGLIALTRHVAVAYGRKGIRCNNVYLVGSRLRVQRNW